jgi:hypothetical protein
MKTRNDLAHEYAMQFFEQKDSGLLLRMVSEAYLAGFNKAVQDTEERIMNEFYDKYGAEAHAKFALAIEAYEQAEAEPLFRPYVLVRSANSGVHFGNLASKQGDEVTLLNSRRVWAWAGACSLSQMAVEGVKKPEECKFSVIVPEITILGVCEIIPLSPEAVQNLYGVPEWKI